MLRDIFIFVVSISSLFSSLAHALPIQDELSAPSPPQGISKRGMDSLRATLSERSENGPVITSNFPDPGLIYVNNQWYAFATRTKGSTVHIQVATSKDFDSWTVLTNSDGSQHDALPTLPSWVNNTGLMTWNTWAPYVQQIGSSGFVMYFSATTTADSSGNFHCVGAATATNVEGPYTGQADSLICPLSQGGAIDPSGFQDQNGDGYITYKVDGNSIGHGGACGNTADPIVPTPLILQPVEQDGITLTGNPTTLLNNQGASDSGIIEGPSITRTSAGTYVLFFSSGCFTEDTYTVSYATASAVTGPYTRNSNPLFATGIDGLTAPGSASVWSDAKHMVFHANYNGGRAMYTAQITVNGNSVSA